MTNDSTWSLCAVTPPWGDRPSIYPHVEQYIRALEETRSFNNDFALLPDEPHRAEGEFGFAPGALEGMLARADHNGVQEMLADADDAPEPQEAPTPDDPVAALQALVEAATDATAVRFYAALRQQPAGPTAMALWRALDAGDMPVERVTAIGLWLATGAADREAVKIGIALLCRSHCTAYREVFITLGRHEEFTHFCTEAFRQTEEQPDRFLWEMAKYLIHWGRVSLIEALADTTDPDIQRWMLTEGYENAVHEDESILICAQAGRLVEALRDPEPAADVLEGAGCILSHLMHPTYHMHLIDEYPDAIEATTRYLQHQLQYPITLETFFRVRSIRSYLSEEYPKRYPMSQSWQAVKDELLAVADAILARPGWAELAREGLASDNKYTSSPCENACATSRPDSITLFFNALPAGSSAQSARRAP